jgi:uroporphyrinogen decarboxylase
MDPYQLKRQFGSQLTLHGAVDIQGWLQSADLEEIEKEIYHLLDVVGMGGGYILAPCHNIQPDTPLENVLALYRAVAKYRGLRTPIE